MGGRGLVGIGRIVRRFDPVGAAWVVRGRVLFVPEGLPLPHASDLAENEDYQFEDLSHQQLQDAQEAEDGKRPYTYFVDPEVQIVQRHHLLESEWWTFSAAAAPLLGRAAFPPHLTAGSAFRSVSTWLFHTVNPIAVVRGRVVVLTGQAGRFRRWEVTARRAGEDQRALQEAALFAGGRVVGVRSVVVSVAGGGATGMRHAHALRGTAGGLVTRSASLRAGLSHQEGGTAGGVGGRRVLHTAGRAGDGGLGGRR